MGILQDQLQKSVHGLKGVTPGQIVGITPKVDSSRLDLDGATPPLRAGALPTSQLHAYGSFEQEAKDFKDAQAWSREYRDMTNVQYKMKGEASRLDLNGATPPLRAGATATSQLHAYGKFEQEAADFQNAQVWPREYKDMTNVQYKMKGDASKLDLNGVTPNTYLKYIQGLPKK